MKNITILSLAAILVSSAGIAQASPFDFLIKSPPQKEQRDDRGDRRHDSPRRESIEAQAQRRLRELGYYRGPIDGDFGRGSRKALSRFQRDNRLPATARLDDRTLRALRIR
jgi:peptidoglycan hydrolase-like protein with peptidoglycan-binding domain